MNLIFFVISILSIYANTVISVGQGLTGIKQSVTKRPCYFAPQLNDVPFRGCPRRRLSPLQG